MSPNRIFILFFLMVAMIAAAALVRIYLTGKSFSWKIWKNELIRVPEFRISFLILSLVFVFIFSVLYLKYDNRRADIIITLNYAEAHKGQNANGTRYNMNEIICDEVLERAIEMGAIEGASVRELQGCLSVEPVVEGDSSSEENYHISTEFRVSYRGVSDLNINAKNIVTLVGYAYKEYFIRHYADNFSCLDISIDPQADFEKLDYLDIVEYLGNQVAVIQNYMYGMADKNSSFISTNGETFYSLAAKCSNLNNVQIQNNLKAYVLDRGISKNAKDYIARLQYDNTKMDYEQQKATAAFNVRRNAISLYAEEMTRIVLVPTWDIEGEYYMGRTKVGIDQLSIEAESSSKLAADYSEQMEKNSSVIASYAETESSGADPYAEEMIGTISSEIMNIAREAQKAGQEYSETRMNKCVSVTVDESSFIKYVILAGSLFVLFYLAMNTLVRKRKI